MIQTYITRTSRTFYSPGFGALLLRVAIGVLFLTHGLMKVGGMDRTVGMFAMMGFPVFVAYFIAYLEVIGGAALIVGIGTRMFAFLFGIEMLVATGVVGFGRGIPLELYFSAFCFAIALLGSGRYALIGSYGLTTGATETVVEERIES